MSLIENRYKALPVISRIFKVIGLIVAFVPIAYILYQVVKAVIYIGIEGIFYSISIQEIAVIIGALIIGLFVYAQGEFINVFMDIEENTRRLRG